VATSHVCGVQKGREYRNTAAFTGPHGFQCPAASAGKNVLDALWAGGKTSRRMAKGGVSSVNRRIDAQIEALLSNGGLPKKTKCDEKPPGLIADALGAP